MFAVQKTSIARNTVVCAAQKPVQAKVRRERRTSRQLNFPRGCPARGFGGHAPFSSIYFRIDPILDIAAPAARIFPRDAVSLSLSPSESRRQTEAVRGSLFGQLVELMTHFVRCTSPFHFHRQAVPQQKAALATIAAFAASVLLSAAPADASVKSTVCASNATAKICLKDSVKK